MEVARNPEIMKTLFTLIRIFVGWHFLYEGVAKLRSSPPFFHYSIIPLFRILPKRVLGTAGEM